MELYGYATYSNMSLLNTSSAQIIVFFIVVLKKICLILTKFIENIDPDYFSLFSKPSVISCIFIDFYYKLDQT